MLTDIPIRVERIPRSAGLAWLLFPGSAMGYSCEYRSNASALQQIRGRKRRSILNRFKTAATILPTSNPGTMTFRRLIFISFFIRILPAILPGDVARAGDTADSVKPDIRAAKIVGDINLSGKLDDPAWKKAKPIEIN